MYSVNEPMFSSIIGQLRWYLVHHAEPVDTGHWQAMKDVPMTKTRELRNTCVVFPLLSDKNSLAQMVQPNLPWAEDQFQERVGGEPLNPGETYKDWPWYRGNVEQHKEQGAFSHTYMERFWPRQAGDTWVKGYEDRDFAAESKDNVGLRYRYGDLNDVLDLLAREPYTRQAYLPIFFPEDTGAHHYERVPCTLGYHFMLRDGRLHCFYPIRSCDFLRHFRDDVYMAGRLVQWVIDVVQDNTDLDLGENREAWSDVTPGDLTMFMPSLHVFEGDIPKLERELND
jgi:hypothetical protein